MRRARSPGKGARITSSCRACRRPSALRPAWRQRWLDMPEDSPPAGAQPRRVEIVVSGATVLKAALVALAVVILIVANEVFLTILLSLVFALGLDPLVGWFTARGIGRGKAALLVFFLLFLAVFVIVVWTVTPAWHEIRGLVQARPGYLEDP